MHTQHRSRISTSSKHSENYCSAHKRQNHDILIAHTTTNTSAHTAQITSRIIQRLNLPWDVQGMYGSDPTQGNMPEIMQSVRLPLINMSDIIQVKNPSATTDRMQRSREWVIRLMCEPTHLLS